MEVNIRASPFTAIIEDINQAFNANQMALSSTEFSFPMQGPTGDASYHLYHHPQLEITLIGLKGQFSEELVLKLTCEEDLFISAYNISGLTHLAKSEGNSVNLSNLKSHSFNLSQTKSFELRFAATINFNQAILLCTHSGLRKLSASCAMDSMEPESIGESLATIPAKGLTFKYNLQLLELMSELEKNAFRHTARKAFIQAQLTHILAIHYDQFENKQGDNEVEATLNRRDLETIMRAINIITNELGQNIKVQELTERLGTNENKLQEGFRLITGLTAKQYILEQRLQRAKHMLTNSDLSISEIVYRIGLTNRGYFSKIFKERFDTSPRVYRKGHAS